jgi:hypothetical protein
MWWDMKAHLYTMLMLSQQWLYVEIAFAFIHSLEDLTPISCGVPELASKQLHSIQMKVALPLQKRSTNHHLSIIYIFELFYFY